MEDLLLTYKAIGSSVINYAAAIYFPNLKPSHVSKLQVVQNQCLRVVTGSHLAAAREHLHHETKTLLVDEHLQLLCRQFLTKSFLPEHPSFAVVSAPSGPRPIRQTLSSRFGPDISPFMRGGVIAPADYADSVKALHTSAVAAALVKLDVVVDSNESNLTQKTFKKNKKK